jgi:hypothetical protein
MYSIGMISCFGNAYFAYENGNFDAMLAWITAACLAAGALGGHLKIKELEDK